MRSYTLRTSIFLTSMSLHYKKLWSGMITDGKQGILGSRDEFRIEGFPRTLASSDWNEEILRLHFVTLRMTPMRECFAVIIPRTLASGI